MDKFYIGIGGFARSGKNLCGDIIKNLLEKNGFIPQCFALADELKNDVEEFLNIKCNTTSYTNDLEEKTKIRPFLVWYGCFQRSRKPDYWIQEIEKTIGMNPKVNVVICTDIRFENEVNWIHSKNGWVIHLTKYTKESLDGGRTWVRKYQNPPNEEEEKNDPVVKKLSNFQIVWEDMSNNGLVKVDYEKLIKNSYLKEEVVKSLQACPFLFQKLKTN